MLRSARRRPQPVVVVLHPRAPELALAAPSSNAGSSSASANELVDIGNRPPIVVAGARSQQQQGPYHHQHHQHQHQPLRCHPAAAALAPVRSLPTPAPTPPTATCVPSPHLTAARSACFCNVATLYD